METNEQFKLQALTHSTALTIKAHFCNQVNTSHAPSAEGLSCKETQLQQGMSHATL